MVHHAKCKAFFLISVFSLLSCANAQDDWSLNNPFSLSGDWMYLRRSKAGNLDLVDDSSRPLTKCGCPDFHVMDVQDLVRDFNWESAAKAAVTIMKHDEKASIEALYYYVWPWEGDKRVQGIGTLSFPFKDPNYSFDFTNADAAEGIYRSQLQNGEFNYWGHLSPRRVNYFSVSWILGGRFIYLRDKFNLEFKKASDRSNYRIWTKNLLYGLQTGGVFEINPSRKWTWTVAIKGAMFLNDVHAKVFLGDYNNSVELRDYHKETWTDAFLLEGIGSLTYHALSHLNIHIGYQAFLATGFALAPTQRDKSSNSKRHIRTGGDLVVDGGFVGLTLGF